MSARMYTNANKIAYLVKEYPQKNMQEIFALMHVPEVEINTALWYAEEAGWLKAPTDKFAKIEFVKAPEVWDFGTEVDELKGALAYAFQQLAKKETDLTEEELTSWCAGIPAHNQLVAIQHLVETKVLATYELTDPEDLASTYTFYSLYENSEQNWGRERFKIKPTGNEVPETDEPVNSDENAAESEN